MSCSPLLCVLIPCRVLFCSESLRKIKKSAIPLCLGITDADCPFGSPMCLRKSAPGSHKRRTAMHKIKIKSIKHDR